MDGSLLPPRQVSGYEYFEDRLTDPTLLEAGVAVRVFPAPLLAVPVGGSTPPPTVLPSPPIREDQHHVSAQPLLPQR
ncbi:DUF6302 family protein [Streptomyces sp. JV176]|uniref:DUF6302 family protein n=1 Tax=Streptomyces sp. JV176 TaxID=858630 RepID=UPI002E76FC35|nr:DUF6302 family protein [Streptomyces sp. JV176]MEE1797523.1 DUF6302 family protein [Streptomyces sp. JV176]